MSKLIDYLYALLEKNQCQAKIVSTKNLSLLIDEIQEFHVTGFIEENFFKERLSWVKKSLLKNLQNAKSTVVVAVPRPQTKAIFNHKGVKKELIIPPTYSGYEQIREKVEKLIENILQKYNYSTKRAIFPLKTLAVRSGLAEYGKNNICYVPKMGSFLQLVAVYTNLPNNEPLQKPKMMKLCNKCNLCQKACPTDAISEKRFLLQAEKCLTYHNEKKGIIPFPDWIEKKWHNCVVGCMYCQKVCPVNKNFNHWIGNEEHFSEKETITLLNEPTINDLSPNTQEKLTRLNLADYLDSLSRNLSVFFNQ